MKTVFGERLRELRISKNWTQVDLAKELNVSKSTISVWETNLSEPTLSNLIAIAKLFNVEIDYLAGLID